MHLWVASEVLDDRLGSGAAQRAVRRFEVKFVRELAPRQPSVTLGAMRPPPPRGTPLRLAATEPAASVPAAAQAVADALAALRPELAASAPAITELAAPELAASVATPGADAFDWPPSTRLSYTLSGYYRGPVEGQAQVEWLRSGERYQVHLDVSVGPPFAPLMSRRMTSEGLITAQGLRPQRYDEDTRMLLRGPRQLTVLFEGERVRLASGSEVAAPPGVQDTASQFVQMTWMFTLQPELLTPGRTIDIPLALPRRVDLWTYDVLERELLYTPAGEVQAVHVRPRREARSGGDLTAEMWVAPSLQYLPVRIVIRQDAETWIDLLIRTLPVQASEEGPRGAPTRR